MFKRRNMAVIAAAAALAVLGASCSDAEPESTTTTTTTIAPTGTVPLPSTTTTTAPDRAEELEALISEVVAQTDLPSLGVTVFNANETIESAITGVRRQSDPAQVEIDDMFSIGSNVKAMTATLVARYVDDGEITWDTTLGDVYGDLVPDLHTDYANITIRQLLNHTGGINDEEAAGPLLEIDADQPVADQRREGVNVTLSAPPHHEAGTYMYSNIGYTFAAAMLEEITGRSWEDLIEAHIFETLGMTRCGFYAPGTPGQVDQPWGHWTELGGKAMDPGDPDADYFHAIAPAGMIHCSMGDWADFLRSQLRGFMGSEAEMISSEAFDALATPPEGSDYGLGWGLVDDPNGQMLWHDGSNDRFTSLAVLVPGSNLGVLAVTNIGEAVADPILADVVFRTLARHRSADAGGGTGISAPSSYDEILQVMASDVSGAVLLVEDREGDGYSEAVGTVESGGATPLMTDTPFRLASTTKPITAAVILRVTELGLLDLDDPIDTYIPNELIDRLHVVDGVSRGNDITIRMLLQHTSGIPDRIVDGFIRTVIEDPTHRWTPTELVEWTIDNMEPVFEPGTAFTYADDGYVLLGMIAEIASGQTLHDLYREFVFDPLGMDTTYLEGHETPRGGPIAHSYLGEIDAAGFDPSFDWGGGGIVSTPSDLATFAVALINGELFEDRDTLIEMTTPGEFPTDMGLDELGLTDLGYGLGLMVFDFDGVRVVGHAGFWGSMMLIAPDEGIVVVANINQAAATERTILAAAEAMRIALDDRSES